MHYRNQPVTIVFRDSSSIYHTFPLLLSSSSKGSKRVLSSHDTIRNLRIHSTTRVVIKKFMGKQATFDANQSTQYGTNIVGGIRPGKDGEHLGLPVLPSMRAVRWLAETHDMLRVELSVPWSPNSTQGSRRYTPCYEHNPSPVFSEQVFLE